MRYRDVDTMVDNFKRAQTLTTTPSGEFGWTVADTSSAGTPTYTIGTGGMVLTLASTDEVENVCMYQNDVLVYDIDDLQSVSFDASVASMAAAGVLAIGLGSARADDEDDVVDSVWFKIEGATSTSALVVETDDGTNDNNDVATGETLGSTVKRLHIDFTNGKSDVRFYVDGARVAETTTFDMSNYSGGLQLMVQLSKSSGVETSAVTIARLETQFKYGHGA